MRRKHSILITLLAICLVAQADNFINLKDKPFNFGAKVGFNASFPIINSLSINGVQATDIRPHYRVGYTGAVFCRVNMKRFFIQPSVAWNHSVGELLFNIPSNNNSGSESEVITPQNHITMTTHSLELPVMFGYNIVKQSPYGLSLMAGPKLKYNYNVSYKTELNDSSNEYTSSSTPFGINLAAGLSVNIGRLFLDFVYEFGLSELESNLNNPNAITPTTTDNLRIEKHTNMMSFSLGFLF